MGASEKAAATYHPDAGPKGWVIVTATDARNRTKTREFDLPAGITAATITRAVGALISSRTVDADRLLIAMREQMTDAEERRYEPGQSRSACDAKADAFGTVIDWLEDTYLPGVTR